METSVGPVLYLVLLVAALASSRATGAGARPVSRQPVATLSTLAIVGVPTLLELTVKPELLELLQRDAELIGRGQVWRLVTALVVQDGGVLGAAFNLATLAVVGVAAEQAWGARRWIAIAGISGVGAELWGLAVQPVGGGNSVIVLGLAGSLASLAVRHSVGAAQRLGVVALTISVVLLAIGDIHGGAATIGAVLGLVGRPPRPPGHVDAVASDG